MKSKFVCGMLCMLMALVALVSMSSCTNDTRREISRRDSVLWERQWQIHTNPVMKSAEEMDNFVKQRQHVYERDSLFSTMTEDEFDNVTSVLIKKQHDFTPDDVMNEFLTHKSVYSNLPGDKKDDEYTALGRPVQTVESTSKDTIIDGKKVKISTTTTQTYE